MSDTQKDTYFLTTAIDYTNGSPHLGHAYEKVLADCIARFHRLDGKRVFFLTGVDQHGTKVQQSAEKQGVSPREFAEASTEEFLALWEQLDVRYDGWAATTDARHERQVQAVLQRLWDAGELYRDTYEGYYSVRQEQFLTDKERGPDGEFGEEWGEVQFIQEDNYYFRLEKHREWLRELLESRPELVFPEFRRKELLNAVENITKDLCISRPKERLDWGLELPFDQDYVAYVWFDALLNYATFAGYLAEEGDELPDFQRLWPCDAHIIGKDIMIPAHGIYWLIMLRSLGFTDEQMPKLLVHGFWNAEGGVKMSKTLGNVVDPKGVAEKFTPEALRYYLMRTSVTGQDADFSEAGMIQRYNGDLAKGLGNLVNRTLNMTSRYRNGALKHDTNYDDDACRELREIAAATPATYAEQMKALNIHSALETVWRLVTAADRFAELQQPWKLAKDESDGAQSRLNATLYHMAEVIRIVAICAYPVLPAAALTILSQLQWNPGEGQDLALAQCEWGGLKDGHVVAKPSPVFPQIKLEDLTPELAKEVEGS
jgi:methionyl-tRNA synthetase